MEKLNQGDRQHSDSLPLTLGKGPRGAGLEVPKGSEAIKESALQEACTQPQQGGTTVSQRMYKELSKLWQENQHRHSTWIPGYRAVSTGGATCILRHQSRDTARFLPHQLTPKYPMVADSDKEG
jgi:hypothetical protein